MIFFDAGRDVIIQFQNLLIIRKNQYGLMGHLLSPKIVSAENLYTMRTRAGFFDDFGRLDLIRVFLFHVFWKIMAGIFILAHFTGGPTFHFLSVILASKPSLLFGWLPRVIVSPEFRKDRKGRN